MNDSFTNMEYPGSIVTFIDPKPEDRSKIALHFYALKEAGHAMISDETIGTGEATVLRIFHYKTCTHANCKIGVS